MRYKVGAEQLQLVPSLAHRPDGMVRVARTAPVGLTHAVCAVTGAAVCGSTRQLHIPRPLKEQALQVCKAADQLHQRQGRAPTIGELARMRGLEP